MPSPRHDLRILVTGSGGFIGRNLLLGLSDNGCQLVRTFNREDPPEMLKELLGWADVVVHLAGVNRPSSHAAFEIDNVDFTRQIADGVAVRERPAHVIFASSIQALRSGSYGSSKRAAEEVLERLHRDTGAPVSIYRLANVFGKWSRPHYNSVVATFCWAAARNLPLPVDDSSSPIDLVYIDDLVSALANTIGESPAGLRWLTVDPIYSTTVGQLAATIDGFASDRLLGIVDRVGRGLPRALYATYLSHLPAEQFSYALRQHRDHRGAFVEVIKTPDCGQVSFFSSAPGVTRGRHYHHTKSEKFVVLQGRALFRFRSLLDGEYYEQEASADDPRIIQTIPGWAHEIVNLGDGDLVALVWANEVFDHDRPDTYHGEIG